MFEIKYKSMIRRFMLIDIDKDHPLLKMQKYHVINSKVERALSITVPKVRFLMNLLLKRISEINYLRAKD